ncbi:MAG: translation initiation factor IF-2 [Clostridia bacterium]
MSLDFKYRIHEVSHDLGVDSKDITELLTKYATPPKNHMAILNEDELNLIFDYFTAKNQIPSLAEYFARYEKSVADKKEETKKAEQEQKAKKAPPVPQTPSKKVNLDVTPQVFNFQTGVEVKTDGAMPRTRYVDTRNNNVDLSKFDNKVDDLIPDKVKDLGKQMEKFKKSKSMQQQRSLKNRNDESERMRKLAMEKKKKHLHIVLPEEIAVSDLAAKLIVTNAEIVKKLMILGLMATASQTIDYDTASLIAEEFHATYEKEIIVTKEELLIDDSDDSEEDLVTRPPVVVVMGHVDHGKTSLLDAIRNTSVTTTEAGGITQHIGAYKVRINDRDLTFLDTPGHEAFTAMRARGASVTDVAILVVAADDGIMPQTVEAINHAKAAEVAIIVAINKMDKEGANVDKIMQELTEYELVPEQWGGDVICVPVSAKKHENIDTLLEMVLLASDMRDLKANPKRLAKGTVIEAKLDKGRGPVATLLVQNGTLKKGDVIIAGTCVGRVRVMMSDKGRRIDEALPSTPVEIVGLAEVPTAGDTFFCVENERMAREVVEQRKQAEKDEKYKDAGQKVTLDDLFDQIKQGEVKPLNLIVKADVAGSVEAIRTSLEKLSNEEVKVTVIHGGVGAINESDVMLATASGAIVIGFNVRPDAGATDTISRYDVDVRLYSIIYDCIEEIEHAMKGMLAPVYKEVIQGHAEVRQIFKVSTAGTIAGCHVTDGKIQRASKVRVQRAGTQIFEGELESLKRFKDDAKEVAQGFDCGIAISGFNDLKEEDVIESYILEQQKV